MVTVLNSVGQLSECSTSDPISMSVRLLLATVILLLGPAVLLALIVV